MAEDQKDRFIQYLAGQHQVELLTRKAMELVLEDFMERQKFLEEQMASLRALQARHKELEHGWQRSVRDVNRRDVT